MKRRERTRVTMTANWASVLAVSAAGLVGAGCGGSQKAADTTGSQDIKRPQVLTGTAKSALAQVAERCDASLPRRESSEYDVTGDGVADVRKVFMRAGEGPTARMVLICRQADLNADGRKDVVRYYNDMGRPIMEEADRDFNGVMDSVSYFENGAIVRQELDTKQAGRIDTKIYFDQGRPVRTERDMAGRSTAAKWQPDRWEYFEGEELMRIGSDLDGDGTVDRWERDVRFRPQAQAINTGIDAENPTATESSSGPSSVPSSDKAGSAKKGGSTTQRSSSTKPAKP
jgi:hypothetical protein